MRPIVSFCGSPTYQLSKYLTTIPQPLTDKSRRKLQATEDFIKATNTVQIPDDYKLVSFDLKSLFTSLALQCTKNAIAQSTDPLPLLTEDFLNICLTSTYFQYNGKHYEQLHGTAMGSPGCRNVSHHYRHQSFSGLYSPGRSNHTITPEFKLFTVYLFAWHLYSMFTLTYLT